MSFKTNAQLRAVFSVLFIAGYFGQMAALKIKSVKTFALSVAASIVLATKRAGIQLVESYPFNKISLKINAAGATSHGVDLVVEIVFIAVGLYVAAFVLPGALTAIATTALTSVNSGVVTLFQTLTPLIAVIVLILLLISVIRRAMA